MNVLNLYAGIGGNRKLWTDCNVTAIELDENVATIYKDLYPNDNVVVGDAHEYLLNNFNEFDFIWSSPPCPTHSDIRRCGVHAGRYEALYPDMSLYQEIILLQNFPDKKIKWVVENVKPYYEPLIPGVLLHRHLFWSNFQLSGVEQNDTRKHSDITGQKPVYGFDLKKYTGIDKRKCLRNMVNPELANHIFSIAKDADYEDPSLQGKLF